jgi:polyphenol oxidase
MTLERSPVAAPEILHSTAFGQAGQVVHGFSTRLGGVSTGPYTSLNLGPRSGDELEAVRENRARFLHALGLGGLPVLAPRQIHSAIVSVVRAGSSTTESAVLDGDAVVTDRRGVALMVLAADCLPILLYDPGRQVIAAVHAGWRGTAWAIAANAVASMADAFGSEPAQIRAALGPAIGRCCYEVGPEVLEQVQAVTPVTPDRLFDPLPNGKGMLDLVLANSAQLTGAGLLRDNVHALNVCTACSTDRFFSHRREGEPAGRAGAVIALPT